MKPVKQQVYKITNSEQKQTGILFDIDQATSANQFHHGPAKVQSDRFVQYLNKIRNQRKARQSSLMTITEG